LLAAPPAVGPPVGPAVDGRRKARLLHGLAEGFLALRLPEVDIVLDLRPADEREVAEPAREEMVRRGAGDAGLVVADAPGDEGGEREIEVDDGEARREGPPRLAPGSEERDDSVDAPVAERRRRFFLRAGLEEERPGAVEPRVPGDAAEQAASVRRRGLDQER